MKISSQNEQKFNFPIIINPQTPLKIHSRIHKLPQHQRNSSRQNLHHVTHVQRIFRYANLPRILRHAINYFLSCGIRSYRSKKARHSKSNVTLEILADNEGINVHESHFDHVVELWYSKFLEKWLVETLNGELRDAQCEVLSKARNCSNGSEENYVTTLSCFHVWEDRIEKLKKLLNL